MTHTILSKNFFVNSSLILITFLLDRISKIYVINLDKKFIGSEIFSSKYVNISFLVSIPTNLFTFKNHSHHTEYQ